MTSYLTKSAETIVNNPDRLTNLSFFDTASNFYTLVYHTINILKVDYSIAEFLNVTTRSDIHDDSVMVIAGQSNRKVTKLSGCSIPVWLKMTPTVGRIMTIKHIKSYELILQFALWITQVHPNFVVVADSSLFALQLYFVPPADFVTEIKPSAHSDLFTVHSGIPQNFVGVPEKIAVPIPTCPQMRRIVRYKRWNNRKVMFFIRKYGDHPLIGLILSCEDLFRHITKFL
jgi:hypothetical protein